jgi:hypothetical protein
MKIDFVSNELCLTKSNPIRLTKARGVRIRCVGGRIWITTPDKLADTFLGVGESYWVASQGLVLVESISDGRVRLETEPRSDALPEWLESLWCASIKRWKTQLFCQYTQSRVMGISRS